MMLTRTDEVARLCDSSVLRVRCIATFDQQALATAKALIGKRPPLSKEADLKESFDAILKLAATDTARQTSSRLRAKAGGNIAGVDMDLPKLYGEAANVAKKPV